MSFDRYDIYIYIYRKEGFRTSRMCVRMRETCWSIDEQKKQNALVLIDRVYIYVTKKNLEKSLEKVRKYF